MKVNLNRSRQQHPGSKIIGTMLVMSLLLYAGQLNATSTIGSALWATPEWQGYTDKDGSGLYNQMLEAIYAPQNIRIKRSYVPWNRALRLVQSGQADMTGAELKAPGYLYSRHPIIENIEVIWFKKSTLPNWQGLESLKGLSGRWILGYTQHMEKDLVRYLRGQPTKSRIKAAMLVTKDRADYYLDNVIQMQQTLDAIKPVPDPSLYRKQVIKYDRLYWLFANTARGKALRAIFDRRFEHLYCSGKLRELYQRWQMIIQYPRLEIDCAVHLSAPSDTKSGSEHSP
ncbi:substrate-binding periplasmic protein [Dongshaea marina]|uniref:substrate-binding periplasmic protein n=1 Tax=Dongshaea marina TaxID=2047966 RepID=UPI000D3E30A0|nr:transporter substrate-binding domain-containing protein [Dongshaea marina]